MPEQCLKALCEAKEAYILLDLNLPTGEEKEPEYTHYYLLTFMQKGVAPTLKRDTFKGYESAASDAFARIKAHLITKYKWPAIKEIKYSRLLDETEQAKFKELLTGDAPYKEVKEALSQLTFA